MGISIWVSRTLDMDFQDTPLLLSITEDRWTLTLDFAPDLLKQYNEGFVEDEAYSLGDHILLRVNSTDHSKDFIGKSCEYCDDTIDTAKDPVYSLHKTFEDVILFHTKCFPKFVDELENVVEDNSHIYATNNL